MKKLHLLLIFNLLFIAAFSQRSTDKEKVDIEKAKYFSYGLTTNTSSKLLGGLVLRHSTTVSTEENKKINRYIALELVNIKHSKEDIGQSILSRVVIGKKNYLFALRPEYGRERYFFKQKEDDGLGMSGIIALGPTIGIQKPYYIKYLSSMRGESPEVVAYDPNIHTDISSIVGSASIWQGFLTNAKVIPGVHLKTAANFDLNTFGDNLTGVELGFLTEYYFKSPEIIANQFAKNPSLYATAYLTLYLGNKIRKK